MKKEEVRVFKVGDKAKVIDERCGHEFEMGSTVTVTELDEDGEVWKAEDSNGESWSVVYYELEKL